MRRLLAAGVLGLLVLVFGVGQLVLPSIAASVLRGRLAKSGRVLSVSVSAFPAIELLWSDADRVTVRMASYRSSRDHLGTFLGQTGDVGTVHASVGTLQSGRLTLTDVRLSKVGDELNGTAHVSEAALRAAVPFLQSVTFVRSDGGTLTLEGTASVLGVSVSMPATVRPDGGGLVVVPDLPLVGAFASVTVFDNPRVRVQSVGGSPDPDGLALSARALLR